ncbi:adenylate kinase [Candidatus Woesearchaeota archaeon]|nr:adenylate kinase [Candidatus Woesearchaeota archaeon]
MNVVLLGPPGVGKGTAAARLAERFHLPHISTGDVFRKHIAEKTALGVKARDYVDSGILVPDDLVTDMVRPELVKAGSGFILDGYPRTLAQAKALKDFARIDFVLNLSAPIKTVVERIKGRGAGRADDNPEIIMQRIREYEEKTSPLIDLYRNEGMLFDIDSTQDVEGVVQQCIAVLEEKNG